jgi:hypothetical protein
LGFIQKNYGINEEEASKQLLGNVEQFCKIFKKDVLKIKKRASKQESRKKASAKK